jgi:hypothetical protein
MRSLAKVSIADVSVFVKGILQLATQNRYAPTDMQ